MTGDIEQILGRKGQTRQRAVRPSFDMDARAGNKGIDVIRHVGPQDASRRSSIRLEYRSMNNQESVLRKQRAIARVILNNPVFSTPFSTQR
jgi:hypothetical protein